MFHTKTFKNTPGPLLMADSRPDWSHIGS